MNILITGASGFIGSKLVRSLISEKSYVVYALVRDKQKVDFYNERLVYISSDLSSVDFVSILPQNIDVVIHLAQSINYRQFPDQSNDIFSINIQSTYKILEWSRLNKIKRFIFASTGNVYASSKKLHTEKDFCVPAGFYGNSKYIGELLVKSYESFFETCIVRLFGIYGPGQKGMIVSNIIEKIIAEQEIELASNIGLEFTPLYIEDCVSLMKRVIKHPKLEPVYNFAGNEQVNLRDLAVKVGNLLSIEPNIKVTNITPIYLNGDTKLIKSSLGFEFKYDFNLGIQKTLFT
jgi:UDP-glucose 4-epimerase